MSEVTNKLRTVKSAHVHFRVSPATKKRLARVVSTDDRWTNPGAFVRDAVERRLEDIIGPEDDG